MGPHRRRSRSSRQRHPQHLSGMGGSQQGPRPAWRWLVTSSCGPKATSSTTCGGSAEQHSTRSPVTATRTATSLPTTSLSHRGRLVLIDLPQVRPRRRQSPRGDVPPTRRRQHLPVVRGERPNPTPTPANRPPRSPPKLASSASTSCPPLRRSDLVAGQAEGEAPAWSRVASLLNGWNLMPRMSR